MGQKAKNAGKKKSKPASNKLADSKSICGNIPRSSRRLECIEDVEMYEKLNLSYVEEAMHSNYLFKKCHYVIEHK